jgi:hypothetical protein
VSGRREIANYDRVKCHCCQLAASICDALDPALADAVVTCYYGSGSKAISGLLLRRQRERRGGGNQKAKIVSYLPRHVYLFLAGSVK